ncbi:MAG TPA: DNA recombination/repair protein RecA, partial [Anaerolineales bacterium]|nr:DNA recombination/repair protein RecA [Anaerolineales bacterium]
MSPRRSKASAAEEQIEIPSRNANMDGAKRAVLDKAVGDILKRYGDGSIMRLGEAQHMQTEAFPTGSLSLDIALGVGGVPRGRI